MAADYSKKVLTLEKNLNLQTGAKFVHLDGGTTSPAIVATGNGCRLLKIVNNTKGLAITAHTGSRQVAQLATTTVEGTYNYGVYCENGIQVEVTGTGSATLVYST